MKFEVMANIKSVIFEGKIYRVKEEKGKKIIDVPDEVGKKIKYKILKKVEESKKETKKDDKKEK